MSDQLQQTLDRHRKNIDVDHFDLTVRELVRMAADEELIRAPEYQRRFRWSSEDESRLIESLFLGLPMPPIFVAANTDGTWELVDGLQRVSTLLHFVADPITVLSDIAKNSPLTLSDLEKLNDFNGKEFSDLPSSMRIQFLKRFVRVTVLSDKSAKDVRFELFDRLNRGAVALSPQEVRSCVYRGDFAKFLRRMADLPEFNRAVKLQKRKQVDGTKEEVVLKFFAYLERTDRFRGAVRSFLDEYMAEVAESFDIQEGQKLFKRVLAYLNSWIEGPLLRSRTNVTPLNQLEAVLVATGVLCRGGRRPPGPKEGWLDDIKLVRFSTKGTNTPRNLKGRIARAKELLQGARVLT